MHGETGICAEEVEVIESLEGTMKIFEERLYLRSLKKASMIKIKIKINSRKLIMFAAADSYWDE
ncbi:hypothetical protein BGZ54_008287 [Gamsiella multidivaricata]|nr:hypothetical protein BGZ54_008287 [Gamsiella multidivaricata]